jgi:hypothetical protein
MNVFPIEPTPLSINFLKITAAASLRACNLRKTPVWLQRKRVATKHLNNDMFHRRNSRMSQIIPVISKHPHHLHSEVSHAEDEWKREKSADGISHAGPPNAIMPR